MATYTPGLERQDFAGSVLNSGSTCPYCLAVTPRGMIGTVHEKCCPSLNSNGAYVDGAVPMATGANVSDGRKPVRLFDHQILALLRAEIEALQVLLGDTGHLTRQEVLHHIEELQRLAEALPESLTR